MAEERACTHTQATVFWNRIRQLQEEDVTVYVKVESANKGGLLVKYGPYDGFVPVSQFGSVSGYAITLKQLTNYTSSSG